MLLIVLMGWAAWCILKNARQKNKRRNDTMNVRWEKLIHKLYFEIKINEWKERYDNPHVLDGEQWELEISYSDQVRIYTTNPDGLPPVAYRMLSEEQQLMAA